MSKDVKKALIFQSLFFCLPLWAQTISIVSPKPGSPLDEQQRFEIGTEGETPSRIAFWLNGQQIAERTQPPFEFTVSWNTSLPNEVSIYATYPSGERREVHQRYLPPKVDVTEQATAFQCFPFPERIWDGSPITVKTRGTGVQPQSVKLADPLPCEWLVVLDISGSMHFFLNDIGGPLRTLTRQRATVGDIVGAVVFDAVPRNLGLPSLWTIPDLSSLFREQSQSSIWDAIAGAAMQFHASPRRMILLISDGADDGSRHSASTVSALLRQRDIVLVWYNPSNLPNRDLTRLSNRSGGFVLSGNPEKALAGLGQLLENQLHVIAPDASYPIQLKWKSGKIRYPAWQE